MKQQTLLQTSRIELVDALRGFAVMAILLVHSLEHFIFPVYPAIADQPAWLNIVNDGLFSITFLFSQVKPMQSLHCFLVSLSRCNTPISNAKGEILAIGSCGDCCYWPDLQPSMRRSFRQAMSCCYLVWWAFFFLSFANGAIGQC